MALGKAKPSICVLGSSLVSHRRHRSLTTVAVCSPIALSPGALPQVERFFSGCIIVRFCESWLQQQW